MRSGKRVLVAPLVGWVLALGALMAVPARAEGTPKSADALAKSWKFVDEDDQHWKGWKDETSKLPPHFGMPTMDKTAERIEAIRYWLKQDDVVATRAKAKDDPKIAEIFDKADKALDEAASKYDDAFNHWCDNCDEHKHPGGAARDAIGNAAEMARRAGIALEGTKYMEADVDRAKKIDQRWKDEIAGVHQEQQATLKKMTEEANTAWPAIEKAANAQEDFKPTDAASFKGKTVIFKKVRNRAGYEFDGQHDVEFWVDSQPVCGNFSPEVKKAFQDARKAVGGNIDDHKDWTIIAVIEGAGTVNRRTTSEVKGSTGATLGKVESTHPVDCTVIRVIALHAGPVAVGAK